MFDWFWEFLYMVSKTIFRLIDGLILCANKLCGIDTINFDGEESDLLTFLFFSDEIGFAFKISALLATILLVVFAVFMIIRSIAKDKAEGTPTQIAIKAFKTLLMFFLVPVVVIAFMTLGNAFVRALYDATMQTSSTPGAFLFSMFAADGGMAAQYVELFKIGEGQWDYTNTSLVSTYMPLSDFPFIFSWLAGGVVLFGVGSAMLIFVDRVISLVILYIAAPISISTSLLDDGARFKLWRDQFLSKFIMGYGMILSINIYALVCGIVMQPGFVFFEGEDIRNVFLNMVMKLLIVGGGALTMQKSMALVGNLVSQGAGSNELRDSMSAGALAKMAGGAAFKAAKMAGGLAGGALKAPFKPLGDIAKDGYSMWTKDKASKWFGFGGDSSKDKDKDGEGSDSKNNDKADYGSNGDSTKNSIAGPDFKVSDWNDQTNNKKTGKGDSNPVSKAIENGGSNGQNDKNVQNNQGNQNQEQKPAEGNKQ